MDFVLTPAMRTVIDHIAALGPRWGLQRDTCAVHGLLYLAGRPLTAGEIAQALSWDADTTQRAIGDLMDWHMAQRMSDGRLTTSSEPWDLLFAAMDERRRREIEPARIAFEKALSVARSDGTPPLVARRIAGLHGLVRDLSAVGRQVSGFSPRALTQMTGFAGRALRALGRA